ncbi:spermidine/putrescine ABC transporter substrate-binding protein [Neiella marina]|uniref:Spermidine/putrescine ABC transporter substrate-binding protein n=1 Tax=Neiella holothuriorum TaxID=2870530 RepID=A0ABS7EIN0_9GAMM|nr:spermidine/putrescine ABC transporter substrate-binding protein [Neiella holothuriorum]MBW8192080.1 spermidine/putrescine ABC transporter substrate-binding protein [Neiella holothuriorum]
MTGVSLPIRITLVIVLTWLLSVTATAHGASQTLSILTWEEYISPEVVADFEAQTGIQLRLSFFDSDEMREQILSSQAGQYFDIALMNSQQLNLYADQERLAQLDAAQLPNLQHLDPQLHQTCGGHDLHGVAYSWGTLGLVYRADKVKPQDIASWAKFLSPPAYLRGHLGGHVDLFDSIIPALISLNYPISTSNPLHLREAFEVTKLWLPNVLSLEYIITAAQSDPSFDEIYVALAYSGDQKVLNELTGNDHWQYLLPSEGSLLWIDCFAVMEDSSNTEQAMRFLNFLHLPENAAKNAEYTYTASPNLAALPLTSKEYRTDPLVYLPPHQRARMQLYAPMSIKAINLRSRILSALEKIHASQ